MVEDMKLSVLMPVYNERQTLAEIVFRVLNQRINGIESLELVIVDDASTDGSTEIIGQLAGTHQQIKPIYQKKNRGKGAAIRVAIEVASGDVAIIQDADLEYDPNDFGAVLTPILRGDADVVYGSRFMIKENKRDLYSSHVLGNRFLTFLSNRFTKLNLTDMETCYKAFRLQSLKTIPLWSNRFGIEPEITAKIAKRKLRFHEVPINYHARTYAEGKKIKWKDGIVAIYVIFKYWLINDSVKKD